MTDPASLVSLDMIKKLVAIDTTSRNSNLDLIHFVQAYLADFGIDCLLVEDPDQPKANLYATLGPADRSGVLLSGAPLSETVWSALPLSAMDESVPGELVSPQAAASSSSARTTKICESFCEAFMATSLVGRHDA